MPHGDGIFEFYLFFYRKVFSFGMIDKINKLNRVVYLTAWENIKMKITRSVHHTHIFTHQCIKYTGTWRRCLHTLLKFTNKTIMKMIEYVQFLKSIHWFKCEFDPKYKHFVAKTHKKSEKRIVKENKIVLYSAIKLFYVALNSIVSGHLSGDQILKCFFPHFISGINTIFRLTNITLIS